MKCGQAGVYASRTIQPMLLQIGRKTTWRWAVKRRHRRHVHNWAPAEALSIAANGERSAAPQGLSLTRTWHWKRKNEHWYTHTPKNTSREHQADWTLGLIAHRRQTELTDSQRRQRPPALNSLIARPLVAFFNQSFGFYNRWIDHCPSSFWDSFKFFFFFFYKTWRVGASFDWPLRLSNAPNDHLADWNMDSSPESALKSFYSSPLAILWFAGITKDSPKNC